MSSGSGELQQVVAVRISWMNREENKERKEKRKAQ